MATGRFVVGSAFVRLRSDAAGLRGEIRRDVLRASAGQEAGVRLRLTAQGLRARVAQEVRQATAGQEAQVPVTPEPNTRGFRTRMRAFIRSVEATMPKIRLDVGINRTSMASTALLTRMGHLQSVVQRMHPIMLGIAGAFAAAIPFAAALASHMSLAASASAALVPVLGALGQAGGVIALGFTGISDVIEKQQRLNDLRESGLATDAMLETAERNVAIAMNNAGEAAGSFAQFLNNDLVPAVGDLRQAIASVLLPRFREAAENLLPTLGNLREAFLGTAESVGDTAISISEMLATAERQQDLVTIAEGHNRILDSLGGLAESALSILLDMYIAVMPQAERFADWLDRSFNRLEAMVSVAREDGSLEAFFQRAGDAAAQWGRILGNTAVALFNMFSALSDDGADFADSLEDITERWREWTESAEGVEDIRNFMQALRDFPWADVARRIGIAALAFVSLTAVRGAAATLGLLLTPGGALALGVGALATGLAAAFFSSENFRESLEDTVGSIRDRAGPQFEGFGDTMRQVVEKLQPLVDMSLDWIEDFIVGFATNWPAIQDSLPVLADEIGRLADAFDDLNEEVEQFTGHSLSEHLGTLGSAALLGGIANLIGQLRQLSHWLDIINGILDGEWTEAWNSARTVLANMSAPLNLLMTDFDGLTNFIGQAWSFLWRNTVPTVWENFKAFFIPSWLAFLGDINIDWDQLMADIRNLWNRAWDSVRGIWDGFKAFFIPDFRGTTNNLNITWSGMADDIEFSWNSLWASARNIWNNVSGLFTNTIPNVFRGMRDRIGQFFADIPGRITGPLNSVRRLLHSLVDKLDEIPGVGGLFDGAKKALSGPIRLAGGGSANRAANFAAFADGGRVIGPGTTISDSIPAMLSRDEWVINAEAANRAMHTYGKGSMDFFNRHGFMPGDTALARMQSGGSVNEIIAFARQSGAPFNVTSSYRNTPDYHGQGMAVDFGGFNQHQLAQHFMSVGTRLLELIHSIGSSQGASGYYVKNGRRVGPYAAAEHFNHIHVAAPPGFSTGDGGGLGGFIGGIIKSFKDWLADTGANAAKSAVQGALGPFDNIPFGPVVPKTINAWIDRVFSAAEGGFGDQGLTGLVGGDGSVMQQALAQAQAMGATNKVLLSLFEAGFVESNFRNLGNQGAANDHDSLGFLQQRPSQGWGTPSQIMNVPFATRSFVSRASPMQDRFSTAGQLAQAVQRSAFPGRYDQNESRARAALRSLGVAGFDMGGKVGGTGNADIQPALLAPGERVLTASENQRLELLAQQGGRGLTVQGDLNVTIPAKDIKEMKDVKDFFDRVEQTVRQGGRRIP